MLNLFNFMALSMLSGTNTPSECTPWVPQVDGNKQIVRIDLDVQNVFNSGLEEENKSFHRAANRLRIPTRDFVVLRELLFKVGDRLDHRLLAESERVLRAKSFLKDAHIFPAQQCENGVVVKVVTKDNWTLQPGVSFGTSGGKSKFSLELEEKNLFGLGKSLNFKYKKGLERDERSIEYYDPNLFGSTRMLRLGLQNNSDGEQTHFNLSQPFKSLHTPYAWEIDYLDWTLINPIYDAGKIVDEIGQDTQTNRVSLGKLIKNQGNNYHRLTVGITQDNSDFFYSDDYLLSELPENRDYTYPWLSYQWISDDYIKKTNINGMGRIEDIALGHQLNLAIGQDFSRSSTHFNFSYQKGYNIDENDLVQFKAFAYGLHEDSEFINTHWGFGAEWHHFQSTNSAFYAASTLDFGSNLYPEQPQYLGAETGLRGYPFRYFNGEKLWLTTVEQRFFYDWYPLRTFQFASALFVDAGGVWSDGQDMKLHADFGIGIRLVPTRVSGGQVIHIDLAFPTESQPNLDAVQLQIRAKKTF